jgi:hypothetical protein
LTIGQAGKRGHGRKSVRRRKNDATATVRYAEIRIADQGEQGDAGWEARIGLTGIALSQGERLA